MLSLTLDNVELSVLSEVMLIFLCHLFALPNLFSFLQSSLQISLSFITYHKELARLYLGTTLAKQPYKFQKAPLKDEALRHRAIFQHHFQEI